MRKIYFFALICSLTATYSQVNISSSLSACYALNGNGNEPINGLTATLTAITPTVDRFNNPNSATSFSGGIGSYITLPNNALLKANAVSISAWVKTNVNNTTQIFVFAHNGCVSYHEGYQLNYTIVSPTAYRFQATKSTTNCAPGTEIGLMGNTTTITANTWYHVGAYFGPDSMKLYVNGVLDATVSNTNSLNYANAANVYLGGTNLTFNLPLNGSLDNIRFYNRKLNGNEFYNLFNADPTCLTGFLPVSAFTLSPANACVNQTITLSDLSTNTPTAWAWQMTGGTPSVSSVSNPSVTYPAPGVYTITLTPTNGYGAGAAITQTVNVVTCTSIEKHQYSLNEIKIYPQPANDAVIISGLPHIAGKLLLRNLLGETVASYKTTEEGTFNLKLNEYSQGVYFVTWTDGKQSFTKKMIKE